MNRGSTIITRGAQNNIDKMTECGGIFEIMIACMQCCAPMQIRSHFLIIPTPKY